MKKIFSALALLAPVCFSQAQVLKTILNRTKQKTEYKVAEKISEKVSDAAVKPIDDAGSGKNKKDVTNNKNANNTGTTVNNGSGNTANADNEKSTDGNTATATLATYSKYDFVPGERVLVFEDFPQDAIGDFPSTWNTNGSGEIVTAGGQSGHWLMISKKGRFIPEYITSLPDNFTFEFDLICNEKFSFYSDALQLFFLTGGNGKDALEYSFIELEKRSGVKLGIHPTNSGNNGGTAHVQTFEDGAQVINNEVGTSQFNSYAGKTKVKVSVWRQKQRVRVYLNEEKVFDLPRAFAANKAYNMAMFELWSGMNQTQDRYLVSNLKLAVGTPDTRNKLITEGKFSTTGILFDVNSDKIRPESYGILKEIANVLSENANVKIKIVGHTDSDGDDNSNLELSKRRAGSVKNVLAGEFNISPDRMQTDGMGEKQPVADNNKAEGKANNRRVEFIKM